MAVSPADFSRRTPLTEAEELAFRYRSLVAAERILERQGQPGGGSATLRADRLRHLRQYIRNAIATVECQMKDLGLTPPPMDEVDPPRDLTETRSQEGPQPLGREA